EIVGFARSNRRKYQAGIGISDRHGPGDRRWAVSASDKITANTDPLGRQHRVANLVNSFPVIRIRLNYTIVRMQLCAAIEVNCRTLLEIEPEHADRFGIHLLGGSRH